MDITYKDKKECTCFRDLVENPTDRDCIKRFKKHFNEEIVSASLQLHERLISHKSASEYNKVYGASKNRIEIKAGTRNKESLELKVRITDAYRKFFYTFDNSDQDFLVTEKWTGQFQEVCKIHVFDINKHIYK